METANTGKTGLSNSKYKFLNSRLVRTVGVLLIAAIVLFGIYKLVFRNQTGKDSETMIDNNVNANQDINKDVPISIKDNNGKEVGKVTMNIQSMRTQDNIIVDGQEANAITGKTFLILNLKLSNPLSQGLQINTRDYIRLSVNGNENEWLAPEVHNDPVQVQAISTKYTRLGFPINDTDTNLVLQVGEISGNKEKVPLNLH